MMMAAIETCSSAIPSARMPISENITANGTIIAAINPARSPRKTTTRTATTMKVCATLESARVDRSADLFGLIGRKTDRVSDRQPFLDSRVPPRGAFRPSCVTS